MNAQAGSGKSLLVVGALGLGAWLLFEQFGDRSSPAAASGAGTSPPDNLAPVTTPAPASGAGSQGAQPAGSSSPASAPAAYNPYLATPGMSKTQLKKVGQRLRNEIAKDEAAEFPSTNAVWKQIYAQLDALYAQEGQSEQDAADEAAFMAAYGYTPAAPAPAYTTPAAPTPFQTTVTAPAGPYDPANYADDLYTAPAPPAAPADPLAPTPPPPAATYTPPVDYAPAGYTPPPPAAPAAPVDPLAPADPVLPPVYTPVVYAPPTPAPAPPPAPVDPLAPAAPPEAPAAPAPPADDGDDAGDQGDGGEGVVGGDSGGAGVIDTPRGGDAPIKPS